jgi:hypothetical protein
LRLAVPPGLAVVVPATASHLQRIHRPGAGEKGLIFTARTRRRRVGPSTCFRRPWPKTKPCWSTWR